MVLVDLVSHNCRIWHRGKSIMNRLRGVAVLQVVSWERTFYQSNQHKDGIQ